MQQDGLSIRQMADLLNVDSHPIVSRWLKGANVESQEALETAATQWLERRQRLLETMAPADREAFVETASSEKILSALAYAQTYHDMVSIYGGPGVGKTRTIHWYRSQYDEVWIATATPATAAVVPALEEVAESLGIQDPAGGARRIARQIRAKVRGTAGLLIIDEAQHLSMAAIEELRSIHDVTKVGLALVGNETSYARIASGNRAANFAQINSRLGLKLFLRRPTKGDVTAVAGHWRVTDDESLKLLERVSQRPGALRSVVKVLRLAGAGTAKALTFDRIRAAVDNLGADA
jgi:DNA transposition AAA+ family ATPase